MSTVSRWSLVVHLALCLLSLGCHRRPPTMADNGGTWLFYEVEGDAWKTAGESARQALPGAVLRRIDPKGRFGIEATIDEENRLKVAIPGQDEGQVERVKSLLGNSGELELLIVANPVDHQPLIEKAQETKEQNVKDGGKVVGRWVPAAKDSDGSVVYRVSLAGCVLRNADTKEPIQFPAQIAREFDATGKVEADWLAEQGIANVEVLVVLDPNPALNISGKHFSSVRAAVDEQAYPCVDFSMTEDGATVLTLLSSSNSPDRANDHYRSLGILFDSELVSAPRIQSTIGDRGRITGRFTKAEVARMVESMQAAALPFPLSKTPVKEVSSSR